jgi:hypothetical protein
VWLIAVGVVGGKAGLVDSRNGHTAAAATTLEDTKGSRQSNQSVDGLDGGTIGERITATDTDFRHRATIPRSPIVPGVR